jgi:hypothetical protein
LALFGEYGYADVFFAREETDEEFAGRIRELQRQKKVRMSRASRMADAAAKEQERKRVLYEELKKEFGDA